MSSDYSRGDVSVRVSRLVRRLLKRYPDLMFTTSSVAAELPQFDSTDVRDALYRESESGLLQPNLQWRCDDCDSPSLYPIDERDPSGSCVSCETRRTFEPILYFQATDALLRDLHDPPDDDLKKADAAPEDMAERIARTSMSPQNSDVASNEDLRRIGETLSAMREDTRKTSEHAARTASATEQSLTHAASTAGATTQLAADKTPRRALFWGVIASIAAILSLFAMVYFGVEARLYRWLIQKATAGATSTPSAGPSNPKGLSPKGRIAPDR